MTQLMSLLHHSSLWLSFKTISCTNNSYKMHEWIFRKCCVHISIHPRAMLHVNVYLSEALWRSFSHWLHCAAASVTSWLELRADECKEVQRQAFWQSTLVVSVVRAAFMTPPWPERHKSVFMMHSASCNPPGSGRSSFAFICDIDYWVESKV